MSFYNDPAKVDAYEKMCLDYDGRELYALLEKHLAEGSSLLELGCGPGNDIKQLRHKYSVTGSDTSAEFLKRCRVRFPAVSFVELDAVTLKTEEVYDCLFSNKVLHHLTMEELEQSLQRQQQVIAPVGLFAHSFWLGDKTETMEGMLFVYHDRETLLSLVSEYFSIVEAHTYEEMEADDSLFIIARNDKVG